MKMFKYLIDKMPSLIKFYWISMPLFSFISTIPVFIDIRIWYLSLYDFALVYALSFMMLGFIVALIDIILIQEAYNIKDNIIEKAFRIYPIREKMIIFAIAGILILGSLLAHNFLSSHYPEEPRKINNNYGIYNSSYKIDRKLTKTEYVNYYRLNALIFITVCFIFSFPQFIFYQTKKQIILESK